MAESTVTQTGRNELVAAVTALPARLTEALKGTARASANRVKRLAQDALRAQLKTDATKLIDNITIEEDAPNKQFLVISRPPIGQPTNITIWNEHGTLTMLARPYMRPAADADEAQYAREMAAAVDTVAARTFGG